MHANHGMQGLVVVLANFVDFATNVTGRDVMAHIAASSARNSFANEGVVREIHPNGSPLPASEWTLMLFASHLSNTIKASSIKVYLAAIRSLHLENGFPNPLANCLRLERVIRGIKRCQGTSKRERLPVTVAVPSVLRRYLTLGRMLCVCMYVCMYVCIPGF